MGLAASMLVIIGLPTLLPLGLRAHAALRDTSLRLALGWAAAAWLLWLSGGILNMLALAGGAVDEGVADQVWYAAAVVSLCPAVAALGARRPTVRVWTAFVLVPLVLVFSWPAWTVWSDGRPGPLQIETPLLLGYALVGVMGVGNYVGTRHCAAALVGMAALGWLAASFADAPFAADRLATDVSMRTGSTFLLVLAAWLAQGSASPPADEPPGWDRVWGDFRDTFGVVWASRCLDRVNATAEKEAWPVRLDMSGFVWQPDTPPARRQATTERIDHTLRWLLRRFVDPPWIDRRL
jgi:hypothetical protein